jgi:RNA polymerase sigma-70 factor (ECF subfamily)
MPGWQGRSFDVTRGAVQYLDGLGDDGFVVPDQKADVHDLSPTVVIDGRDTRPTARRLRPRPPVSDRPSRGEPQRGKPGCGRRSHVRLPGLRFDPAPGHQRRRRPDRSCSAERVAQGAIAARRFASCVRPALINGAAGVVAFDGERPFAVLAFTVVNDRTAAIDIFNDPELVAKLDIYGITA